MRHPLQTFVRSQSKYSLNILTTYSCIDHTLRKYRILRAGIPTQQKIPVTRQKKFRNMIFQQTDIMPSLYHIRPIRVYLLNGCGFLFLNLIPYRHPLLLIHSANSACMRAVQSFGGAPISKCVMLVGQTPPKPIKYKYIYKKKVNHTFFMRKLLFSLKKNLIYFIISKRRRIAGKDIAVKSGKTLFN